MRSAARSADSAQPLVDDVDPDQRVSTAEAGQPKRDQAHHALAVDGDRFANRDLRPSDSVQGHVAENRERRRGVVDFVRHTQQTVLGVLRHKPVAGVWSRAQDAVARREARDLGANRLDHADRRVAEWQVGDIAWGISRAPSADGVHLGACTDLGQAGPHKNVARTDERQLE